MPVVGDIKYPSDYDLKQKCVKAIVKCIGVSPKLPQHKKAIEKIGKIVKTINVKRPPLQKLTDKEVAQKKASAKYYQDNKAALNAKHIKYNKKNKKKINKVRNKLRVEKKKKGLV